MIPDIIYTIIHAFSVILLVYCILSWFPNSRESGLIGDLYRLLGKIVDPLLNLIRKVIPPIGGTIDISPIIAMIALEAIARILLGILF